jgi:hypothetical protein
LGIIIFLCISWFFSFLHTKGCLERQLRHNQIDLENARRSCELQPSVENRNWVLFYEEVRRRLTGWRNLDEIEKQVMNQPSFQARFK